MRALVIPSTILFLFLSFAGGVYFGLQGFRGFSLVPSVCCAAEKEYVQLSHGIYSQDLYDRFYEKAEDNPLPSTDARSGIIAHHLVVGEEVARITEALGGKQVNQVFLISPNHFDVGYHRVATLKAEWSTPYGSVIADSRVQDQLLAAGAVQEDYYAVEREHGINSITPFIKRSFPNADFIPITIHETATEEELTNLAEAIDRYAAPDAVILSSIDMSHNLPLPVQEFHDELTQMTLRAGEWRHDLEIDSNATMKVLLEVNRLRGTQDWNQTYYGSSLATEMTPDWLENTSHIMGYFEEGEPEDLNWSSFTFVGDIMLDRGVRKRILEAAPEEELGDPHFPWEHMSRFLRGVDLKIGNLEGTVNEQPSTYTYNPPFRFVFHPEFVRAMLPYIDVVSLANNHSADVIGGEIETREWLEGMNLPWFGSWASPDPVYDFEIRGQQYRLIGYHEFKPDFDRLLELIAEGEGLGRFIMVMPHWGIEYQYTPSSNQKFMAQRMVDAGADLIIGGHPHVVQGMELIDGSPVIYSLGNFIFDQQIPVTWGSLALGVIRTDEEIMLYLLPLGSKDSQPIPYGGADADQVLRIVADASPEELREDILQYKLIIPYVSEEKIESTLE